MSKRIPMSLASHQGISRVAAEAADGRVWLTSHGRVVAVVDSAERLDEDARRMREAATAVLDAAAAKVSARSALFDLDDACAKLGVDAGQVRKRAAERMSSPA